MLPESLSHMTFNGQELEIYAFTGTVADQQSHSETHVSGGGGGGYVAGGTGYAASAPVSSTTTHYQNLFLVDEEGNEKLFEFTNFSITCRPGQTISLVGASKEGGADNTVLGYNHDVNLIYYHKSGIEKLCHPGWRKTLIALAVSFLFISLFGLVYAIIFSPLIVWFYVFSYKEKKVEKFKKTEEIKSVIGHLRDGEWKDPHEMAPEAEKIQKDMSTNGSLSHG